uniref:Uncharacterized protein n=1 Tax=Anguilla anguilla TaxID=7936 RepID=A0A0E9UTS0_ANGAN
MFRGAKPFCSMQSWFCQRTAVQMSNTCNMLSCILEMGKTKSEI